MATLEQKEAELRKALPLLPEVEGISEKQRNFAMKLRRDFLNSLHGKIGIELDKMVGCENEDGEIYTVELLKQRLRKKLDIEAIVLFDTYREIMSTTNAADIIDTIEFLYRYH